MTVTVLIKRKVAPENEKQLEELYLEMRSEALKRSGYIGAETLKRVDVKGELLVISKWRTVDDWSKWLVSKERMHFQERIDAVTSTQTKFEVYSH